MSWTLIFDPLLPGAVLGGLGAFGLVLAALMLWRHPRGALLRIAAFALLLLALFNPSLQQVEREPLSDVVVVVRDESASQKLGGRAELSAKVAEALDRRLAKLSGVEVRKVASPGASENRPREGTLLFGDLSKALAEIPTNRLAGVILITDGQVHDVPAKVSELGISAPVHALITGKEDEFDRRIELLRSPRFGLVGGEQTAKLRVRDSRASSAGKSVTLRIVREGEAPESRQVKVGETVEVPIRFSHAGVNIVELEVEGAPRELTTANNRAVLSAEGVRENLRVLLVSGEPHAGERVWRNLLKSDAAVDLVHFTILRPPEKQDGTPINQLSLIAFPTRELFAEKLEDFDLIIFDRYHRRGVLPLLYLDNVARYVEQGGAVLVASGEHFAKSTSLYRTPLSYIIPAAPTGRVIEQAFRPQLTAVGNRHPVTRGLTGTTDGKANWGRWFRMIEADQVRGSVVMEGPEHAPLLVLNREGEGRVALLLSDQAWLWSRGFEGGGPYTDLLRRLAHWLMKEPDLEEDVLTARARGDSLVIERRSMEDSVAPVELTAPDGEKTTVELNSAGAGVWRKTIAAAEQGVYRLGSGKLSAVAHVGASNAKEFADLAATQKLLKPVLEATGGGGFWVWAQGSAEKVTLPRLSRLRSGRVMHGSDWMGLKRRDAAAVRGIRLFPVFAGIAALIAMLGLLAATWFREGG